MNTSATAKPEYAALPYLKNSCNSPPPTRLQSLNSTNLLKWARPRPTETAHRKSFAVRHHQCELSVTNCAMRSSKRRACTCQGCGLPPQPLNAGRLTAMIPGTPNAALRLNTTLRLNITLRLNRSAVQLPQLVNIQYHPYRSPVSHKHYTSQSGGRAQSGC